MSYMCKLPNGQNTENVKKLPQWTTWVAPLDAPPPQNGPGEDTGLCAATQTDQRGNI
jgi:hypothetical protein